MQGDVKRHGFSPWVRKIRWRRAWQPTPVFLSFPYGSAGKQSACNTGDLGLIPRLGRSPGEGKSYLLQYSGLENATDCIVLGVAMSQTGLSDFHFHCTIKLPFVFSCDKRKVPKEKSIFWVLFAHVNFLSSVFQYIASFKEYC